MHAQTWGVALGRPEAVSHRQLCILLADSDRKDPLSICVHRPECGQAPGSKQERRVVNQACVGTDCAWYHRYQCGRQIRSQQPFQHACISPGFLMAGVRYCSLGKHPDTLRTKPGLYLRTLNRGCGWAGDFVNWEVAFVVAWLSSSVFLIVCAVTFSSLPIRADGFSHWKCLRPKCLIKRGRKCCVFGTSHITGNHCTIMDYDCRSSESKHCVLSNSVRRGWARVFRIWVSCLYKYKLKYKFLHAVKHAPWWSRHSASIGVAESMQLKFWCWSSNMASPRGKRDAQNSRIGGGDANLDTNNLVKTLARVQVAASLRLGSTSQRGRVTSTQQGWQGCMSHVTKCADRQLIRHTSHLFSCAHRVRSTEECFHPEVVELFSMLRYQSSWAVLRRCIYWATHTCFTANLSSIAFLQHPGWCFFTESTPRDPRQQPASPPFISSNWIHLGHPNREAPSPAMSVLNDGIN